MKTRIGMMLLAGALALAMAACGSSSSDDNNNGGTVSASSLSGTWYGTIENPSGALGVVTVVLDSSGNMTITTPDGTLTGTAVNEQGSIFGYTLSDGTVGGFMADSSATHAGFTDEYFYFGVVQKGASALPSAGYTQSDVVGSWSGTTVELTGSALDINQTYSSSATVAADGSINGSDVNGAFSGGFAFIEPTYGRYRGSVTQGAYTSNVAVFLSVDKQFAAGYGCLTSGSVYPDDCSFTLWHK